MAQLNRPMANICVAPAAKRPRIASVMPFQQTVQYAHPDGGQIHQVNYIPVIPFPQPENRGSFALSGNSLVPLVHPTSDPGGSYSANTYRVSGSVHASDEKQVFAGSSRKGKGKKNSWWDISRKVSFYSSLCKSNSLFRYL